MVKYFLGFDSSRLTSTFSYVNKNYLIQYFNQNNISYTTKIEDDFEEAIFPSASDFFAYFSDVLFKKVKTSILACNETSDLEIRKVNGKNELSLSLDAVNYYRKATKLLILFPEQETLIKKHKIKTPIEYLHIFPTYQDLSSASVTESTAFRHFYRIPINSEIVVSYGSFSDRETIYNLESCALICPNLHFLFFGYGDRKAFKKDFFENITPPKNITFLSYLPSELYFSFLMNANKLLLFGDFISYPQIIIDCMYHNIPIILYKISGYENLLNENTVSIAKNFSSLLTALTSPKETEKIEFAHNKIINYLNLK